MEPKNFLACSPWSDFWSNFKMNWNCTLNHLHRSKITSRSRGEGFWSFVTLFFLIFFMNMKVFVTRSGGRQKLIFKKCYLQTRGIARNFVNFCMRKIYWGWLTVFFHKNCKKLMKVKNFLNGKFRGVFLKKP